MVARFAFSEMEIPYLCLSKGRIASEWLTLSASPGRVTRYIASLRQRARDTSCCLARNVVHSVHTPAWRSVRHISQPLLCLCTQKLTAKIFADCRMCHYQVLSPPICCGARAEDCQNTMQPPRSQRSCLPLLTRPGSGHLDSQVSPRQVRVTMTIIGSDQDLSPVKSGIVHDQIHYTVHSTHWAGRSQRNPENATMKCAK